MQAIVSTWRKHDARRSRSGEIRVELRRRHSGVREGRSLPLPVLYRLHRRADGMGTEQRAVATCPREFRSFVRRCERWRRKQLPARVTHSQESTAVF